MSASVQWKNGESKYIRHHSYNWSVKANEAGKGLTGYRLCGTAFTGGDHDQKLHNTVVDLPTSALDDEDILLSYRSLNAHGGFSVAEFLEICLGWGGT